VKSLPIISVSGIRGIVGTDINPSYVERVAAKFGSYLSGGAVVVSSDTRSTSPTLRLAAISGLLRNGCTVFDLGYSSTPSVFKEVAVRRTDGGMILTASHNPPDWNGIKFVLRGGRGVFEEELSEIRKQQVEMDLKPGRIFRRKALYQEIMEDLTSGKPASGIKVALDLAGGVGSLFIPGLLSNQGCKIISLLDAPGIFPRTIDPTSDPLELLTDTVKKEACDVGFAFDCDADRLVIVDADGRKLSGDVTLLICLRYFLENSRNRNVAISVDTSLAAESLIRENNGQVFYAKVGEANVVKKIVENNCGAGGEGSSGGYIQPSFVMCRDGVYGSTLITQMIKSEGSLKAIISSFKQYYQKRVNLEIDKMIAPEIIERLSESGHETDRTDGLKIRLDEKSWVLIRASNTENVVRLSAEASAEDRAREIISEYKKTIKAMEIEIASKR
jgi:phosphomannomutase